MITDRIGRHEVLLSVIITITKFEKNFSKANLVEDLLRFFITAINSDFLKFKKTDISRNIKQISIVIRRQKRAHANFVIGKFVIGHLKRFQLDVRAVSAKRKLLKKYLQNRNILNALNKKLTTI